MSDFIIEYLGKEGVKTTPFRLRIEKPKSGDVIDVRELKEYPFAGVEFARIEQMNFADVPGLVHSCVNMGSAFLSSRGTVQISGGPFFYCLLDELIPTWELRSAKFWNWGDNWSGPEQGVNYMIERPVFKLPAGFKDEGRTFAQLCAQAEEKANVRKN